MRILVVNSAYDVAMFIEVSRPGSDQTPPYSLEVVVHAASHDDGLAMLADDPSITAAVVEPGPSVVSSGGVAMSAWDTIDMWVAAAAPRDVPVVVLTTYLFQQGDHEEALARGAAAHIIMPFDHQHLWDVLNDLHQR